MEAQQDTSSSLAEGRKETSWKGEIWHATTATAFPGGLVDVYFFHQDHTTQLRSPYLDAKSAFVQNFTGASHFPGVNDGG